MEPKDFIRLLGMGTLNIGVAPMAYAGIGNKKSDYEKCKVARDALCGNIGNVYETDAFSYVHPWFLLPQHRFLKMQRDVTKAIALNSTKLCWKY